MAKSVKYTTTFKNLKGNNCVVEILVEGFSGTATTLTAGEDPLVLETNAGSHEWLSPLMLTSGFLRLWLEESQVQGMMPTSATSHLVKLKIDNQVKWTGYLKQEALTAPLYDGANEYEFPVWCPMSVLDTMNLTFNENETQTTIGHLIWRIFSMLTDITYNYVYVVNNLSSTTTFPELSAIVDIRQFFDLLSRPIQDVGNIYGIEEQYYESNTTCLKILEEICKFWGWTMLLDRGNIYMLGPDAKAGYRYLSFTTLGSITGSTQAITQSVSTESLASKTYLTTDHQYAIDVPKKKIEVKSAIKAEDPIFAVNVEQAGQFAGYPDSIMSDSGNITADCVLGRTDVNKLLADGIYISWDGWMSADIQQSWGGDFEQTFPIFRKYDKFTDSQEFSKKSYSWSYAIFLSRMFRVGADDNKQCILKLESVNSYSFTDCALVLEANILGKHQFWKTMDVISGEDNRLYFRVTVGNKRWDYYHQQWADSASINNPWFVVPIGADATDQHVREGKICRNTIYSTPYQGADGFAIPVETPMSGRITIEILWTQYPFSSFQQHTNPQWYLITGLKFRAVPKLQTTYFWKEPDNENSYTENLDGVGDEKTDLKLKTWNNTNYGSGLLIAPSGGWLTSVPFAGGTTRPESNLLQRMKALYGQATEWRDIVIEDAYTAAYPIGKWNYTDSEGTWAPCGYTRRFRDCEVKLNLGKLPTN